MAVLKGGVSGAILEMDAATKSARVQSRPIDVAALGSYQIHNLSGTMAAGLAGGSPIYSCRWGDATRAMLLRRVSIQARTLATAFTAGAVTIDMILARSFTASDTGGTSILPTGNSQKRRTSFGTTLITDLRRSDTATLTAGTRTLDGAAVSIIKGFVPATQVNYPWFGAAIVPGASTVAFMLPGVDLFNRNTTDEWPLVFVQNEGFVLRATVPATGTWDFDKTKEHLLLTKNGSSTEKDWTILQLKERALWVRYTDNATNPAKTVEMGRKGRTAVLERYNWGTEEKKLLALYGEIREYA